jgi:hypothetical protein
MADDVRDDDDREAPTLVPPFDLDAFARGSELKLRASLESSGEPTIEEARRLHRAGEHERALFLLAGLLEVVPLHKEAGVLSSMCRVALEAECLAAIGSRGAVLAVAVTSDELKGYALDNVSAFLLSRMDGGTDVETLLDIAGLPRLLALRHMRSLVERGIVLSVNPGCG